MHGALVLDFDSTEDGRAADVESLASGGWISLNILCLVIVSAEDSDALYNYIPIDRTRISPPPKIALASMKASLPAISARVRSS